MLTYCALVPARNEEKRLASTLQALRSRSEIGAVIVIDDASRDRTAEVARASGADQVIVLPARAGKGGALQAGIDSVGDKVDVLLFLDADLGDSATECVKLIAPIERDEADMTIGTLPPDPVMAAAGQRGGGMGLVVGFARAGIAKRTGQFLSQPLSGQRAIRRNVLHAIGGRLAGGFGIEVGLTLAVLRHGYRIQEVETMFRHRVTGSDLRSALHRARQLIDVAAALRG